MDTIRPPIVVILGHVDHGKTTLLDFVRKSRVAAKEAGGITQHIGAYVATINDKRITFLDTPGHEAFSAIRSRGAKVADIAILVIAAEEGLKPQTKEAIKIIKESETPFIVAINKIDKDGANPQRVRQELAEAEVMVEDYGGQVPVVEISGQTGQGVDHLLETILLVAELEELSGHATGPAHGYVLESHMDSKRGTVATLLVQSGTLNIGDTLVAGTAIAKVKSLEDFLGKVTKSVGPSQPCVVLGWESVPPLGATFQVASRDEGLRQAQVNTALAPVALFAHENMPDKRTANLIIKADVQSSLEAIDQVLRTIKSEEVDYKVVGFGVGKINDNDIKSASATHAAVIGFHVDTESSAKRAAEREQVRVETFDIIYKLVELVRDIMSDLLDPEIKRNDLGKLKILALFGTQGKTQIVGGKVTSGKAVRGALVTVMRGTKLFATGKIVQLQQKKADVSEVAEGLECGLRIDVNPSELGIPLLIKEGDVLEIYEEQKIKRSVA
ncbi:MAG: translation initiation factor IF-2 [Patescibacteria group bacterium]